MTVLNLNLSLFFTIDLTEKNTSKTRQAKYLKRFNILCYAIGFTVDGQKHLMLLTYIDCKCLKFTQISLLWGNLYFCKPRYLLRHILYQVLLMNFLFRQLKQRKQLMNVTYIWKNKGEYVHLETSIKELNSSYSCHDEVINFPFKTQ